MKFNEKFAALEKRQEQLEADMKALKADVRNAMAFTDSFLKVCKKNGISKVAIMDSHPSVPSSVNFVFGVSGSVFAEEQTKDGWPAIWRATEEAGIGGGAGNSGQHQISIQAQSKLIDGTYHYKAGKWERV